MAIYFGHRADAAVHRSDPASENGAKTGCFEDIRQVAVVDPIESFQLIQIDQSPTEARFITHPLYDVSR